MHIILRVRLDSTPIPIRNRIFFASTQVKQFPLFGFSLVDFRDIQRKRPFKNTKPNLIGMDAMMVKQKSWRTSNRKKIGYTGRYE